MKVEELRQAVEALLLAASHPLSLKQLIELLTDSKKNKPKEKQVQAALAELEKDCQGRGIVLKKVSSGYCYQTREELIAVVSRLWDEKPPRYTRALLETLALIAYRQPITRAEIEEVRGVSISTYMIQTLEEREWIRVSGRKETPGRPALYVTTNQFLDYFNLSALTELPPLMDFADVAKSHPELSQGMAQVQSPEQPATQQAQEQEASRSEGSG